MEAPPRIEVVELSMYPETFTWIISESA